MQALAFYLFSAITVGSAIMVVTARNPVHSVFFLIMAFFSASGLFVLLGAEFLAMMLVVVYVGAVAVLFLFVVMMLDIPIPDTKKWFIPKTQSLMRSAMHFTSYLLIFAFFTASSYSAYYAADSQLNISQLLGKNDPIIVSAIAIWFSITIVLARKFTMMLTGHKFSKLFSEFYHHFPVGWLVLGLISIELAMVVNMWSSHSLSQELSMFPTPPTAVMSNTNALGNIIYTDYIYAFQICGMILLLAMIGAIVLTLRKRAGVKRQSISDQINRTKEESVRIVKVQPGQGVNL